MGPYIWDDFFSYFIGVCLLERGRPNFTDLRLTTAEQCPCLALSVPNEWSKEDSIKSKITSNPVHTSCTQLHRRHYVISVHSSKATPPSTDDSSNITSHHPSPVKGRLQWVKGEVIKVKSSLIERTPPKQRPLRSKTYGLPLWNFRHKFKFHPESKHRWCCFLAKESNHLVMIYLFFWLCHILRSLFCLCSKSVTKMIKFHHMHSVHVLLPLLLINHSLLVKTIYRTFFFHLLKGSVLYLPLVNKLA